MEMVVKSEIWKKIEQSNVIRRFKTRIREWIGHEPVLRKEVDLDLERWGGWAFVKTFLREGDVLYSLGVSDDIEFEREACGMGVRVHAFDPTPYCIDWIGDQDLPAGDLFRFYPWAAAGRDGAFVLYPRILKKGDASTVMYTLEQEGGEFNQGIEVRGLTLASMARELGHATVDLLKMDIEGAEYEVIDAMLVSRIRPRMLLIEFHHRFKTISVEKTRNCVKRLREAGYRLAHVSESNREVCFVHDG